MTYHLGLPEDDRRELLAQAAADLPREGERLLRLSLRVRGAYIGSRLAEPDNDRGQPRGRDQ
jgi:hypothetical protein